MSWELILLLATAGMAAGFIDAVAGGGGLISMPTLLWTGMSPKLALGTNKLQSACGTVLAVRRYVQAGLVSWREVSLAVLITFPFAALGTWVVFYLVNNDVLKKIVPWLLMGVAAYALLTPKFGQHTGKERVSAGAFAWLGGTLLGFYDGFFGPGTGSFWTVGLLSLRGMELTRATAFTKVVNLTSNVASLLVFLCAKSVDGRAALAMIAGQLIGARAGAGLVLKHGAPFVRVVFLVVVFSLTGRLLWQSWHS